MNASDPAHEASHDLGHQCSFCSIAMGLVAPEPWNQPLAQTANFFVLPSLGALVEGWLLLIPKSHQISMGALPQELFREYDGAKAALFNAVHEKYGSACAFEHGPSDENRLSGCGVDHAHLHIVPIAADLEAAVSRYTPPEATWQDGDVVSCQAARSNGKDYLYLERARGHGRILVHSALGSQLFRRAIADLVGVSDLYNWREHRQDGNVAATIATFGVRARGLSAVGAL